MDWGAPAALGALVEFAELSFVQRLEEEGGYLPAANCIAWRCSSLVNTAAAASSDSEAKLQWLAGRGARLESASDAMYLAAEHGNLAALQLLLQHRGGAAPPDHALYHAAAAGSIATASWLQQAGCTLTGSVFWEAFCRGDLPMVRWLLEAESSRLQFETLAYAIRVWPRDSTADGERLVEAVRLLAAAGWPTGNADGEELVTTAACEGHPWAVCHGLLQLRELHPIAVLRGAAAEHAAAAGCQATLKALVGMSVDAREAWGHRVYITWYKDAARNGDRGTLAWLLRQGLAWGGGVVSAAAIKGAPPAALRWLVEQGRPLYSPEILDILYHLSYASSPRHSPWQQEMKAWMRDCTRRWMIRLCLTTVWLVCVLVVVHALLEELHGGQYGFWASTALNVFVFVVSVVAVLLWSTAVVVAHVQLQAP